MAQRRMFSMQIVDTDAFMDMPLSAQALYFHLGMRADDDGFVSNARRIQRLIGAADDDLKLLALKRFVLTFDSGIVVIKHWKMLNTIKGDRYKPTLYQEEKATLFQKPDGAYTDHIVDGAMPLVPPVARPQLPWNSNGDKMEPEWNQTGSKMEPQDRLGKDKLGKDKREEIEKDRGVGEGKETPHAAATVNPFPYDDYLKIFCENCPSLPKPQKVESWTEARKKALRSKKVSREEFRDVCKKIERSDFLSGRSGVWAGCSLDWILKPANWQKIVEGNYDNRGKQKPSGSAMPDYSNDPNDADLLFGGGDSNGSNR